MSRFQVRSDQMRNVQSNADHGFRFEPEIEPMFITLSLYDFKERKKVWNSRSIKLPLISVD